MPSIRQGDPAMVVLVLSDYQFTHFRKMIPENMLGITHHTSVDNFRDRWKGKTKEYLDFR